MIKVLSFWYSKIILRFFKVNEKDIYRNREGNTIKFKKYKSHLMFNEACYNNDILPTYGNIYKKMISAYFLSVYYQTQHLSWKFLSLAVINRAKGWRRLMVCVLLCFLIKVMCNSVPLVRVLSYHWYFDSTRKEMQLIYSRTYAQLIYLFGIPEECECPTGIRQIG